MDPPWWIQHICTSTSVFTHLLERGVIERGGRRGIVDTFVADSVRRRLDQALTGSGLPDARTAAVVVLANAGGLFDPKKKDHYQIGLAGPIMTQRLRELSSLPSLDQVRVVADGITQIREDAGRRSTAAQWQLSS
jgi:hypothetical protein